MMIIASLVLVALGATILSVVFSADMIFGEGEELYEGIDDLWVLVGMGMVNVGGFMLLLSLAWEGLQWISL